MKKSIWIKALCLCLCLVVLAGFASASTYELDLSKDGKVNVWDIQLAVNDNKEAAHSEAILTDILGNPDEIHTNSDGEYEIYTALGLYNMAKHAAEGKTFRLMNDIDLNGAEWAPVEKFRGTFDGQGYTVSNMTITQVGESQYQGFFATVDYTKVSDTEINQSVVKDLNLENVNVVVNSNARFVGLFAGQVRGVIQDCTVTGFMTDTRTTLTKDVYYGCFAGRINDSNPDGILKFTESFDNFLAVSSGTVGEQNADDKVDGITAKMGMDFGTLEEGSKSRIIGLYGAVPSAESLIDETGKVTWNWQDISNTYQPVSQELLARRQTAAQYMYDMGTVYWTPSQDLMIINYKAGAGDRTSTKYKSTSLYRGIPYNHGSSSLERFDYWVNNPDLPTDAFYLTDDTVIQQFNDALLNETYYMLNGRKTLTTITGDTGWKWTNPVNNYLPSDWSVEPTVPSVTGTYLTGFGRYIGNDCSSAAAWAWRQISAVTGTGAVRPNNTNNFFPSPKFTTDTTASSYTGIVPVGGITFEDPADYASSTYAALVNAAYNAEGGADKFLNALSQATTGDCLMGYSSAGGHTRMLMGDAVTIRTKKGKIDTGLSYVITTEQGGGGSSGTRASDGQTWYSSWKVNKKYTFADLVEQADSAERYFPVTCTALQEESTAAATAWCKLESGTVKSNYQIVSTTVDSEVVFTKTGKSGSRTSCTSVKLADVHTATTGTVTVLLSNGQTYTFDF